MIFSKSFSYALRGVLYIAFLQDEGRNIHVEEMADKLSVPKHFMGKILKKLVKHDILSSLKGPNGGFSINNNTATTTLITIRNITDGPEDFDYCTLHLHTCNDTNPCPLHHYLREVKARLLEVLTTTTVNDLLITNQSHFIESITTDREVGSIIKPITAMKEVQ